MGAVHDETLSQNKGCHEWEALSLSEISVIKSLIKNRCEFDTFYEVKLYESRNPVVSNGTPLFHEIIECMYLDLERLIIKSKLSKRQELIINLLMQGNTEEDIAFRITADPKNIRSILETACQKIKEQNDIEWQEWIEINGYTKIPSDVNYKQCGKCGKWLRANEYNFSPHGKGQYNLHPYCKNCR